MKQPVQLQEAARLAAVRRYDILDTPPDHATERLEQPGMLFQGTPVLTNPAR